MIVKIKYVIAVICIILVFSTESCSLLFTNKMFQTPNGYQFGNLTDSLNEYVLREGDRFELQIYSNHGDKLIDPLLVAGESASSGASTTSLGYEIDLSGNVNLPKIGVTHLGGMKEGAAASYLENLYKACYIDPFVHFAVTNKRITVFRANANAEVILLENNNMTITEAIGKAGGLTAIGKSSKVKLMRQQGDSLAVMLLDFSTIEGAREGNKKVEPNDIIYIEPAVNTDFIKEVTPIITVVSSIVVIFVYFSSINKN